MGDAFWGVDNMLQENFLPRLFLIKSKYISPNVVTIITMTVKKSGLDLLDIVTSTNKKHLSLQRARTELICNGTGEGKFSISDRLLAFREERRDGKKYGMTPTASNSSN